MWADRVEASKFKLVEHPVVVVDQPRPAKRSRS